MENEQYNAVVLNDDYTPFMWVLDILENIFGKSDYEEAVKIVLHMHQYGSCVVDAYPEDVAKQKIEKAMELSAEKYPHFKMKLEKAET